MTKCEIDCLFFKLSGHGEREPGWWAGKEIAKAARVIGVKEKVSLMYILRNLHPFLTLVF